MLIKKTRVSYICEVMQTNKLWKLKIMKIKCFKTWMQQHPFYCCQTKDGCQKNIAKCRFQFPTLIQVIIRSTNPLIITLLLPTVFYASSASRFIITLRNISSCKLHRTNRDPDFLKGSFNKKGYNTPHF